MTATEVYQAVMAQPLSEGLGQPEFLRHLNAALSEICNLYGEKYTVWIAEDGSVGQLLKADDINDGLNFRDEYFEAVCDNIRYRISGNADYRTLFGEKAQLAYRNVWSKVSKGRTLKPMDWSDRYVRQRNYGG